MIVLDRCCKQCRRSLTSDEIGLYKRLVRRNAEEFLCLSCMAEYYGSTEEYLLQMIEGFRAQGCTLFG